MEYYLGRNDIFLNKYDRNSKSNKNEKRNKNNAIKMTKTKKSLELSIFFEKNIKINKTSSLKENVRKHDIIPKLPILIFLYP